MSSSTYHISPRVVAALLKRYDQERGRAVHVTDWAVTVEDGHVVGVACYTPVNDHILPPGATNHGVKVG